jgi:hypothetical protein
MDGQTDGRHNDFSRAHFFKKFALKSLPQTSETLKFDNEVLKLLNLKPSLLCTISALKLSSRQTRKI